MQSVTSIYSREEKFVVYSYSLLLLHSPVTLALRQPGTFSVTNGVITKPNSETQSFAIDKYLMNTPGVYQWYALFQSVFLLLFHSPLQGICDPIIKLLFVSHSFLCFTILFFPLVLGVCTARQGWNGGNVLGHSFQGYSFACDGFVYFPFQFHTLFFPYRRMFHNGHDPRLFIPLSSNEPHFCIIELNMRSRPFTLSFYADGHQIPSIFVGLDGSQFEFAV